jgi:hypothetical protein
MLSREVLPDPGIESVVVTSAAETSTGFRYRIRNVGGAAVDLSAFTMRTWFSADESLDSGADLPAGSAPLMGVLAPGASIEAQLVASAAGGNVVAFPYLLVQVDSGGTLAESSTANNRTSVRRPPPDLVFSPLITWEPAAEPERALVTWNFRGAMYGVEDAGFRIDVPGFGAQEVPPGTRSLEIPFGPGGERPCSATVAPLRPGSEPWPAVATNNLCN